MDNNAIIVQILAVVLILFFCFVTYMNTKTWRTTHVVFMFLVFGAAMVFTVYGALIGKTRKAWMGKIEELEKKLVAETEKVDLMIYGERKVPQQTHGTLGLGGAVSRTIIDRGKVYRDCRLTDASKENEDPETKDATVIVKLSTLPEGANPNEKVEKPNNLALNTVVYAFKDMNQNAPHTKYEYIGEFKATEVSDAAITLTSTTPMLVMFQNAVDGPQPWVLYERMPADSHAVFSQPAGDPLLPEVKPEMVLQQADFPDAALYQAVLWEYQRDGMAIDKVKADRAAKMQVPLTPAQEQERTFAKVKFLKEHTVRVDAPLIAVAADGSSEFYDSRGQALDPRFRRSMNLESFNDVTFKVGDEAEMIAYGFSDDMVTEKGARELAAEGVLTIQEEVYRRPLNDYAYEFEHMQMRRNQIREALRLVNLEIATVAEQERLATLNTKARQDEQMKLTDDQKKLLAEKQKVTEYADKLAATYREVRSDLSRLYRENAALHERIVAENDRLAREIEDRVASPTALER